MGYMGINRMEIMIVYVIDEFGANNLFFQLKG